MLAVLLALLWFMMYASLPDQLNGMKFKPFSTAGEIDRMVKLCAIAAGALAVAMNWSQARRFWRYLNPGMVAFMALALLSTLWSIDSNSTFLRCISLAAIVSVCIGIPLAGWESRRFQHAVAFPVMSILILSLVVGILYPDKIIEIGDDISLKGAWHGVTLTKNLFGMIASVGVVLYFGKWMGGEGKLTWSMAGTAISFLCLMLSRSNTSMFATLLAILFQVVVLRVPSIGRRYTTHIVAGIAGLIFIYQMAIQGVMPGASILLEPIASLTGKDMTFSARSTIWEIVKENIRLAPYLGSGYAAYWAPTPTSPSNIFMYVMYFWPSESHNGYLEIVNDLGIVGLVCLLAFLFWYMRQALQLMRFDLNQGTLYMALLVLQLVMNMSESEWFSRSNTCAILLLASTCMSRALMEQKAQMRNQGASLSVRRNARSNRDVLSSPLVANYQSRDRR